MCIHTDWIMDILKFLFKFIMAHEYVLSIAESIFVLIINLLPHYIGYMAYKVPIIF